MSVDDENPEVEHSTIPACLNNPTLGAAANGVFLDVIDAQIAENRRAEIEGRPARIAKRDGRYPGWEKPEGIASDYEDVDFGTHFTDGEAVMTPQTGAAVPVWTPPKGARKRPSSPSQSLKEVTGTSTTIGGSGPQRGTQTPSQPSGGKSEHS